MPDWRTVQLHEVADIRVSNVDKKAVAGELPVKLCNYMDVYGNDYIRADLPFMEATATAVEIERFGVRRGDVMITKDSETPDDIGIASVVLDDIESLVCGYHLAQLRPREAVVDPTYLSKQLSLPETSAYFAQRATGSTRYGLSTRTIAQTPIRLAPLVEQQRIAAILTSLDTAIEATEALIEKHQQIKAGLMLDLFTRGVGTDGTPRRDASDGLTQTPLGRMPAAWHPSTVGQSFGIDSGITLGPHRRPAKRAAPYLRVANVYRDELRLDDISHLEAMAGDESCVLRAKDLLVVEGHANPSEIGRCAIVTEAAAGMLFQNHLFRLRAHAVSAEFGLLWLNSFHLQRYWERTCSTSSGLNTINRRMLNAAPIYVPSSEEQACIVAIAGAARGRLDAERTSLAKLRMQKQGLMQDLLTGKVPVRAD